METTHSIVSYEVDVQDSIAGRDVCYSSFLAVAEILVAFNRHLDYGIYIINCKIEYSIAAFHKNIIPGMCASRISYSGSSDIAFIRCRRTAASDMFSIIPYLNDLFHIGVIRNELTP